MSESHTTNSEKRANFEGERLDTLQRALDPITFQRFDYLEVKPGWRCLEVGAGAGSVAEWLAGRIGPEGVVVATDIDLSLINREHKPNVELRQHDIVADDLEQEAYDLVHARAVLMHLANPVQAVKKMVAALRPGGWLFLEEFDQISFGAVETENPMAQAFTQKMGILLQALKAARIMNMSFGRHLSGLLQELGLLAVGNEGRTSINQGGGALTQFQLMNLQLAGPPLVAAGVLTPEEVKMLERLFVDPSFYYVGPVFFGVWGKRDANAYCSIL